MIGLDFDEDCMSIAESASVHQNFFKTSTALFLRDEIKSFSIGIPGFHQCSTRYLAEESFWKKIKTVSIKIYLTVISFMKNTVFLPRWVAGYHAWNFF